MDEVFGVTISEGAIANLLARAEAPMIIAAEKIAEDVRSSPVVASDETSARVKGKTWWQWVLLSSTAIYHVIADSRGAKVVIDFLQGAVPEVWVADRYAAQNGHGIERHSASPICCATANMPSTRATPSSRPVSELLLLRAVAIGRRRESLKDSTLVQYRADLDRRLTRLLGQPPTTSAGCKLARAIRKCRNDLFVFVTRRDVPYTNNGCERAPRPSVIFRKVSGCFRSHWGARLYAAAASAIATGRLNGKSALQAIQDVIAAPPAAVIP